MAWPTTFGGLATGNQNLSLFDTMFNAVGLLTAVPCSCSGTNTIALTPQSNTATQTIYANYQLYAFVAANTSTGSVTVNVNSIGALNLYLSDGATQAGSGNLVAGAYYLIAYNSALNTGSGGFQIIGLPANTTLSKITASLGSDVALNNSSNYFDCPSVAQGTSGIWFASGNVVFTDTVPASVFCKLWDGTTVIDSGAATVNTSGYFATVSLSGFISSPAGNIRISCKNSGDTTGSIKYNASGNSKDSTITAFRIG